MTAVQKKEPDVTTIFLAFLSLQGDVKRTALAFPHLTEEAVAALALKENWAAKLGNFDALKAQDSNVQISINRALSYVQASQLSAVIDEVIKKFSESPENLMDLLTAQGKNGSLFSTKPITDLVKAAAIVQDMRYRALGDSGAPAAEDKVSGGSIGLSVAKALQAVQSNPGVDAVSLVQKSLATHDNAGLPIAPAR